MAGVQNSMNTVGNASPVFNNIQSSKGPIAVPLRPDFSVQGTYLIDLTILNQFQTIDYVQTLFIDNSGSSSAFYAQNLVSSQTIICPPNCQGYFPFLCPNPGKFNVISAGGVAIPMELLNFPVQPAVWNVSGNPPFAFDGGGNLKVTDKTLANVGVNANRLQTTDVSLDAIIANVGAGNGLNVNVISGGGGAASIDQYKSGEFFAGGNVYTPAVGKSFLLNAIQVTLGPRATADSGVASKFRWTIDDDVSGTMFAGVCTIPAVAPAIGTSAAGNIILLQLTGLALKSVAVNNKVKVTMSALLDATKDGLCINLSVSDV